MCQKKNKFVIVLEHYDTNSFCFILHMISDQMLNTVCTALFIHRMDTRIVLFSFSGHEHVEILIVFLGTVPLTSSRDHLTLNTGTSLSGGF